MTIREILEAKGYNCTSGSHYTTYFICRCFYCGIFCGFFQLLDWDRAPDFYHFGMGDFSFFNPEIKMAQVALSGI